MKEEETIFDTKVSNNKASQKNEEGNNQKIKEIGKPSSQADVAGNKQKKQMGAASVMGIAGAAGVAGTAIGIMTPLDVFSDNSSENGGISGGEISGHGLVGHDMNVATSVDDSMSFEEAFAAAREEVGPGGIFVWHGHVYGTYYESEWNAISPEDREQYWADVHHTVQHNEYLGEHLQSHGAAGTHNTDTEDQNIGASNEGQMTAVSSGNEQGEQQTPNNQNGGGNEVIPTDPPGGWNASQEPVEALILDPDGKLILTENQVMEEIDQDGDGVVDMAIVDADGNVIPDVLLDTTGDGEFDTIALDAVENGDIISLENTQEINGVCIIEGVEVPPGIPIDEEVPVLEDNLDLDPLANTFMDPDIPIDNNMNMGEFV